MKRFTLTLMALAAVLMFTTSLAMAGDHPTTKAADKTACAAKMADADVPPCCAGKSAEEIAACKAKMASGEMTEADMKACKAKMASSEECKAHMKACQAKMASGEMSAADMKACKTRMAKMKADGDMPACCAGKSAEEMAACKAKMASGEMTEADMKACKARMSGKMAADKTSAGKDADTAGSSSE